MKAVQMREFQIECSDLLAGAEACARDLLENSNGTSGRVGVRHSSLSKLLGCNWNLEKSIATGTHNSEPPSGTALPLCGR